MRIVAVLRCGALLGVLLLTACGGSLDTPTAVPATSGATPPAASKPLTKIVVAMGYIPNVQFAPYYVAEDKGYYAAEGLQVEFKYGQVNDLLKVVAQGDIDFANVSGDEMVPAVAQGIPVRYIMTQYYHYPIAAVAISGQGAPLTKPADLKGRKIGIPGPYGSNYIGLKALLKVAGLQESDIQEQSIGYTQVPALLNKQVDVAMVYSMNEPVQIQSAGKTVQILQVADSFDLAAVGVATGEKKIKDNPDQIRAFLRATLKGTDDTLKNPDAAFTSSMARTPEIQGKTAEMALQRAVLTATLPFMTPPAGRAPGSSDAETWKRTEEFLRSIGQSKQPIDPATLYTNEFLNPAPQ
ncbi:MAG TPA: ABC transporter substrate-binding protein [Chloroflexia bacterium]|nr:ABC transporter substrate-binding protein [Chloroflexia bacterium]